MFSKSAEEKINLAISAETKAACSRYGNEYSSLHEGFAVLKEEVDESRDEYVKIKDALYKMWNNVRFDNVRDCKTNVEAIREHAEKLALEAIQICAVCEKTLKTI